MNKKVIQIPLFNINVTLLLGDVDKIHTYLSSLHNMNSELPLHISPSVDGECIYTSDGEIYIWLHEESNLLTIIHECGHATFNILEEIGIEGEEAFCYIQEYLIKEVLLCMKYEQTVLIDLL